MNKIAIIGGFGHGKQISGGGTVKTREIYNQLLKQNFAKNLLSVDIYCWREEKILIFFKLIFAIVKSKEIIFIASTPSFLKIFRFLSVFIKDKKVHFIPVGPLKRSYIGENDKMLNIIKKIDFIYVQTEKIKIDLKDLELKNIIIMKNFKDIEPIKAINSSSNYLKLPLKFCFLSRVTEAKGIIDAIEVFIKINNEYSKNICKLDIYGAIDEKIKNKINYYLQKKEYKDFLSYKGIISPNETTKMLEKYFMMIFPTKFDGEGFPGVLLDAFSAGIPILSSKFAYHDELLVDNETAILFEFGNNLDMYTKLKFSIEHRDKIYDMRKNVLKNYEKYTPEKSMKVLLDNILN